MRTLHFGHPARTGNGIPIQIQHHRALQARWWWAVVDFAVSRARPVRRHSRSPNIGCRISPRRGAGQPVNRVDIDGPALFGRPPGVVVVVHRRRAARQRRPMVEIARQEVSELTRPRRSNRLAELVFTRARRREGHLMTGCGGTCRPQSETTIPMAYLAFAKVFRQLIVRQGVQCIARVTASKRRE